jgi:DNA-binding XRE family transcriptional regulator
MHLYIKTKELEISAKGDLPDRVVQALRREFGQNLEYKSAGNKKSKMSPADAMKHYRKQSKMSQSDLGETLGNIPKQHISNMENGIRAISLPVAKKLASIFKVPVENFL